ncbi:MAG: TRAP transporter large permease [Candidatus Excrementavichristensenella sp.]|jgi:tripartite ATP-independent transporter DctM subunit
MNWTVFAIFATMIVCFVIRMPISFSMLCSSIVYFLLAAPAQMGQIGTVLVGNTFANYTMLAAPLFIFMANVLNEADISAKLFAFCNGLLGRMKGGSAQVNVFLSLIFSGMTGSAIADASGVGTMEIEHMRNEGYPVPFACAVTAASATIGPVFPPSIPMVIYAMLSGASVGKLFMGGVVPGILLAVIQMIYVAIVSYRRDYPTGVKMTLRQFGKATLVAIPALFTAVLLLVGIYSGICTPTEAGALASAWAILIAFLVYRSMGIEKLLHVIRMTARNTATLALLTGTSLLFSFVISREQIAIQIAEFVVGLTDNKYVFLFVVNIVFLLLGCVMDVSTIQYVFIPMVLPLVRAFGIDLVHFGVVICLNMMIGLSTPPFGMVLFIVTGVGQTKMAEVIKEVTPFVIAMIALLFLLTYVPEIVMYLPNRMG